MRNRFIYSHLASIALIAMIGCQYGNLDIAASDPDHPQNMVISSQLKRVINYDCHGKVATDKMETVSEASKILYIPSSKTPSEVKIFNATTNSRAGCIIDNKYIRISERPDSCAMQVKAGINELHYGIFHCDNQTCTETEKESGTIYINVELNREHTGGIDTVQPQCDDAPIIKTDEDRLIQLSRQFLEDYPLSFSFD